MRITGICLGVFWSVISGIGVLMMASEGTSDVLAAVISFWVGIQLIINSQAIPKE